MAHIEHSGIKAVVNDIRSLTYILVCCSPPSPRPQELFLNIKEKPHHRRKDRHSTLSHDTFFFFLPTLFKSPLIVHPSYN